MTEFKVPELGENVAGGDVTRVMVNVGDTITRDQAVLELETDKATIEVPSSVAGVVKEIKVKKGEKIKVGAVVLTVDDASGNGAGASTAPQAGAPAAKARSGTSTSTGGTRRSPQTQQARIQGPADAEPAGRGAGPTGGSGRSLRSQWRSCTRLTVGAPPGA